MRVIFNIRFSQIIVQVYRERGTGLIFDAMKLFSASFCSSAEKGPKSSKFDYFYGSLLVIVRELLKH